MESLSYEIFFRHTSGEDFISMMNKNVVKGKLELKVRQGREPADISFIDSAASAAKTSGLILLVSGELATLNPKLMDYSAMLYPSSSPRHCQTFRGLILTDGDEFIRIRNQRIDTPKTKFCNYIYSHPIPHRNRFARQLMKRKRVDCPGYCLNNMKETLFGGASDASKTDFMSSYKFSVCFEHTSYPGYVTEKIYSALWAASVPIYKGAPDIASYINPKCFINVNDFPNDKAAIDHIMKVDRSPELHQSYLRAAPFPPDSLVLHDSEERLNQFYMKALRAAQSNAARPSFATRLYRRIYRPLACAHLLATYHHVDGLPLRDYALDWRGWLRSPLTVLEKIYHYRGRARHVNMRLRRQ